MEKSYYKGYAYTTINCGRIHKVIVYANNGEISAVDEARTAPQAVKKAKSIINHYIG